MNTDLSFTKLGNLHSTYDIDFISVLLALIIILLFMAILAMLRTLNSPFIRRFCPILFGRLEELKQPAESYCVKFKINERSFQLLEIKHKEADMSKSSFSDYIFMKTTIRNKLFINFLHPSGKIQINNFLNEVLGIWKGKNNFDMATLDTSLFLNDMKILTNNAVKARVFLNNNNVASIIMSLKTEQGVYSFPVALIIEPGSVTLDYRLNSKFLNEIIRNPRNIKKHISILNMLADELEKLSD